MREPDRVIEVRGLTKTFGTVRAVQDLSFTVSPGRITGFLGPNGAGKTTTLRMLLGLVTPTAGTATIAGRRYADLPDPLRTVGAALEATGFHAGRSARDHLRVLATTAGIPDRRVDDVLAWVGLQEDARRRTGGFSMGMRQRLALAAALLGDPPVLLLDEPSNGLDPEGIVWLRGFLRRLAAEGRTVLISSHVLSEVRQTVDDVLIISTGRLIRQASLAELEGSGGSLVLTPSPADLIQVLASAGLQPMPDGTTDEIRVPGAAPAAVGALAHQAGIELHGLRADVGDLERTFLALTAAPAMAPDPAGGPPDPYGGAEATGPEPSGSSSRSDEQVR